MRKQVVSAVAAVSVVFVIVAAVYAADAGSTPASDFCSAVFRSLKNDATELGITPAQEAQFKAIAAGACVEAVGVVKSVLVWDEKERKLLAIGDQARQQALSQLTPEQMSKLANIPAAQLLMNPAAAESMITAYLGLTPEQKKEGNSIIKNAKEKAVAVLNDTSLTDEARRAQWMQIGKDALEDAFALLTEQQKQKVLAAFRYGG